MLIFYHCSHLFDQNPAQLVKNLEVWVIFGDIILASLFGDGKIQITVYLSITVSKIQKTVIRSNLVWLHIHMIWTISISTSISISKSKSNLVRLHISVNHPQPPLLVQSLCQGQPVLPVDPLVVAAFSKGSQCSNQSRLDHLVGGSFNFALHLAEGFIAEAQTPVTLNEIFCLFEW